ncbi:alpha/beta-hydrolase [Gonapodya prolifera JEL478]|uniref:Alpha/beta-hydrolase n=1 Tax=Gonapodya prolifera (strain JEL478) TaxID=1344416 RepID=A0A139AV74_GONPJ|nr:alpha/beta-hydrolase [Gonapodya prolifera JEL478]|eukprot:KXS20599.1 alpha/beta-hydrolase [Gonapodya prolifera JEL478]
MPSVTLSSGQLVSYLIEGKRDAPCLVFLHALFMDASMWEKQTKMLSSQYLCVSVNLRGHGDTPATEEFTPTDLVNDVFSLLDTLNIHRALIIGVSQGGWLGIEAALTHPDRVSGVVVIAASIRSQSKESRDALVQLRDVWVANGIDAIMTPFVHIAFGDDFKDEKEIKRWRDAADKRGKETYKLAFESAMSRQDLDVSSLKCPTLVIHAKQDRSFPFAEAEYTASAIPKEALSGLVLVEGGAHVLPVTHPELIEEPLKTFVNSVHEVVGASA